MADILFMIVAGCLVGLLVTLACCAVIRIIHATYKMMKEDY